MKSTSALYKVTLEETEYASYIYAASSDTSIASMAAKIKEVFYLPEESASLVKPNVEKISSIQILRNEWDEK